MIYLLGSVEGISLVNIVFTVDHPEYLEVLLDDAAGVVALLPHDAGVRQVQTLVTSVARPARNISIR